MYTKNIKLYKCHQNGDSLLFHQSTRRNRQSTRRPPSVGTKRQLWSVFGASNYCTKFHHFFGEINLFFRCGLRLIIKHTTRHKRQTVHSVRRCNHLFPLNVIMPIRETYVMNEGKKKETKDPKPKTTTPSSSWKILSQTLLQRIFEQINEKLTEQNIIFTDTARRGNEA